MKTTGITRRIDELGRIVIPKEIRKNMHLKTGELLEIYLSDSETILLKKYSRLNTDQEFIYYFVKTIGKKINCDVYITNLDKVVFSTNEELQEKNISVWLEEQLKVNYNLKNMDKINLLNNYVVEGNIKVYPISPNGDIEGIIIFSSKLEFSNKDEFLIDFFVSFIKSYFEL